VVYFFLAEPGRIYMAAIYAKSRKETLSAADQNVLAKLSGADQESGTRRAIIMGVGNLNTGSKRRTKLGMALEQSAKEILAHVKGEARLPTRRIVLPDEVDVRRIRTKAGMSQAEFARAFCINPRTLQEWEQGRRKPDATTRAYLAVIARNREAVLAALAS
jgi:putative transcriptional regulator